jgi:hypothetical protein
LIVIFNFKESTVNFVVHHPVVVLLMPKLFKYLALFIHEKGVVSFGSSFATIIDIVWP